MTLDVVFTPRDLVPGEVAGRTVFVIDILRATTSMITALANGARGIVPAATPDEAVRLARSLGDDAILAGERNCERIPGFALGNSPADMTAAAVAGRLVVMGTTNGTAAMLAAHGAAEVYAAAAVNLTVAAARAREAVEDGRGLLLLCAGRAGGFGLDDAYTAGRLLHAAVGDRRSVRGLNDAAVASLDLVRRYGSDFRRPLRRSGAGRQLLAQGHADDLAAAAAVDAWPVLPRFGDGMLTTPAVVTAA